MNVGGVDAQDHKHGEPYRYPYLGPWGLLRLLAGQVTHHLVDLFFFHFCLQKMP